MVEECRPYYPQKEARRLIQLVTTNSLAPQAER
jgi:hypothetical protein